MVKLSVLALAAAASAASATVLFDSNFASFSNGNLVGQGGWIQGNGASATLPLQVASGRVLVPGGQTADNQDAVRGFTSVAVTGQSVVFAATFTINSAPTSNSSYLFAMLDNSSPTAFANARVAFKDAGGGTYNLGIRTTGQGANPFQFGGALNYGQEYTFIMQWDYLAGADTLTAYINPTSSIPGSAYVAATNNTADPGGFTGAVISQFGSGTTQNVDASIGHILVADSFADAYANIPAPTSAGVLALAGLAAARRRRA